MIKHFASAMLLLASAAGAMAAETVSSPDGEIKLTFDVAGGRPTYSVTFKGREVIRPSHLGFRLAGEMAREAYGEDFKPSDPATLSLTTGFEQTGVSRDSFEETWKPVWGEETEILNRYNSMTVSLSQPEYDRCMNIEFRVFDDGFAFRYDFPAQPNLNYFVIGEELSEFAMTGDHWAYWIPGDYDTQEYNFTKSRLSEIGSLMLSRLTPENASTTPFSATGVQTALQLQARSTTPRCI